MRTYVRYGAEVRQLDLTTSHAVEILGRSVVMLSPGQPALVRGHAVQVLEALVKALSELERATMAHAKRSSNTTVVERQNP